MKRKYISPDFIMVIMKHDMGILCGSVKGSNGIGYGGVDTEGVYEINSREGMLTIEEMFEE